MGEISKPRVVCCSFATCKLGNHFGESYFDDEGIPIIGRPCHIRLFQREIGFANSQAQHRGVILVHRHDPIELFVDQGGPGRHGRDEVVAQVIEQRECRHGGLLRLWWCGGKVVSKSDEGKALLKQGSMIIGETMFKLMFIRHLPAVLHHTRPAFLQWSCVGLISVNPEGGAP